ncbi:hypothetical protein SEA_IDAHO_15 [Arthrobacter phage Idaho]|uniref:Uncharacterized protein n=1 Tax=Arthrobacter phage Idaho TaxID=2565509 RepID=A0A4D6T837_9CAUD|nr:hypothetical protein QEX67_gp15 [Arthrobacter phage Idaho]QCG78280.1 hypothetical protein SEA_IDAHO_15 [Arthrobacter phage Idaho]
MNEKRSIGPVTAASTVGAAAACLAIGLGNRLGWDVTVDEAWSLVIVGTALGGFLVKPKAPTPPGRHE